MRDGTLVVRPDSGDPPVVVREVLERLGRAFGAERNAKGFRVLPPQVRVIQGDGVDHATVRAILFTLKTAGWSADNVAFGMGGGLLQKLHRDTQQFAFKCSEIEVRGARRPVFKDPVTDPGKRSKRGRLSLVAGPGGLPRTTAETDAGEDLLREVFVDGKLCNQIDFEQVRRNARLPGC